MVDSGCFVLDVGEMKGSDEPFFSLSAKTESKGKSTTSGQFIDHLRRELRNWGLVEEQGVSKFANEVMGERP